MDNSFKIKSLVVKAFGNGDLSRDKINFAVKCPSCGGSSNKRKLVIRLDDSRYHCWVCGIKGKNISSLLRKYRPDLADSLGKLKPKKQEEEQHQVKLPPGFVHLASYSGKDPDLAAVVNYLRSRGLNKADIFRWRMISYKTGQFRRRVVIPSFNDQGEINYYVARAIDNKGPKYRNAKSKKKNIIFNEVDIDWSQPVILVEGIFDAIMSPENAIPILGSYLSKDSALYQKLVSNQSTVYLSLDPDMKDKSYKIAELLEKAGCSVFMSYAPAGKDLGDMKKTEVRDLLKNSEPYSREFSLYHKISKIKSGSIV